MPYPMGTSSYAIGQEKIPDDLAGFGGLGFLNDDVENPQPTVIVAPAPEPGWFSPKCLIMAALGVGACLLGLKYFGGEQMEEEED